MFDSSPEVSDIELDINNSPVATCSRTEQNKRAAGGGQQKSVFWSEDVLSDDSDPTDFSETRESSTGESSDDEDIAVYLTNKNSSFKSSVNKERQVSPGLFKNNKMEPLTFVLLLHDFELELKLTKLIEEGGGYVHSRLRNMDGHCIVLVKDNAMLWGHDGPVFKVSYLKDCYKRNKILNIMRYVKPGIPVPKNISYMDVVYLKKYTWDTLPGEPKLNKSLEDKIEKKPKVYANKNKSGGPNETIEIVDSDSNSSTNEISNSVSSKSFNSKVPHSKTNKQVIKSVNKRTRMFYSRKEDEEIIKFLVKKKAYTMVSGVRIWKQMEDSNIFPNRTWQSLKEHFIKKVVYQLDSFQTILTDTEKMKFQNFLAK